jgi:ATP-dependent DNA helicase RecG
VTADEVTALLARGQGESNAFFLAGVTAPRLAETLVAFANSHGGDVLLGVSAAGRPAGFEDAAAARELVQTAGLLATPPLILPMPQSVQFEGKLLCAASVPAGLPHAYSINGRYLVRAGVNNRLLSPVELTALLLARNETGFEARAAPGATLADLDGTALDCYLAALQVAPAVPWQDVLLARGCLTSLHDGLVPTYAGVLLFGRQPQRFLRNAQITLIRYAGPAMSDEFLRQDASGTLPDQVRQAEAFLSTNMRRGVRISGLERSDMTEYPMPVVREALVNAVAHRDYSIRGDEIRLLMFSDHLEIYSPGRLPGHVTLDNLLTERFSRNEAVVQVLSDLGFVERLGYGIDRMVAAMNSAGLPPPSFQETVAGFRVTIRGRGDDLVSRESAPRWGNRRLNPRQERALALIADKGSITNREFRELFPELSDETIRRELADLVDNGLIVKIGERKATYYILK